jgi:GTPase SAR1 family protein
MTPHLHDEATDPTATIMTKDTTSATENTTLTTGDTTSATEDTTSKRHHPEQAISKIIKLPTMISPETIHAFKVEVKSKQEKMKSKMTKKAIKKKMENALKRGDYKMKIGRLIFWDFGGQYVYYTTHQSFMTYRALFLVVFDGRTNLYDEVPDVLGFPGQYGTPTPAGMDCLR